MKKMKKIVYLITLIILGTFILSSCEYEYDDFEAPKIYIPQSGLSLHQFGKSDTTYSLSVYLAGVRENESDIHVKLNLATDDFNAFNSANNNKYTLLPASAYIIVETGKAVPGYVFDLKEAETNAKMHKEDPTVKLLNYIDPSTTKIVGDGFDVVIPKGESRGNITFTVSGSKLEVGKEYILPFKIAEVSKYELLENKSVAYFRIIVK